MQNCICNMCTQIQLCLRTCVLNIGTYTLFLSSNLLNNLKGLFSTFFLSAFSLWWWSTMPSTEESNLLNTIPPRRLKPWVAVHAFSSYTFDSTHILLMYHVFSIFFRLMWHSKPSFVAVAPCQLEEVKVSSELWLQICVLLTDLPGRFKGSKARPEWSHDVAAPVFDVSNDKSYDPSLHQSYFVYMSHHSPVILLVLLYPPLSHFSNQCSKRTPSGGTGSAVISPLRSYATCSRGSYRRGSSARASSHAAKTAAKGSAKSWMERWYLNPHVWRPICPRRSCSRRRETLPADSLSSSRT